MAKLTPKQDAFVKEYLLNGGNGTQAAIKAGYSSASAAAIAEENLRKPYISQAIKEHQKLATENYVWSKEDKLKKLELMMNVALKDDAEKGMINMPSFVAALKVHNEMQGDNAPTRSEVLTTSQTLAERLSGGSKK